MRDAKWNVTSGSRQSAIGVLPAFVFGADGPGGLAMHER